MRNITQSITSALVILMLVGIAVGYSYTSTGFKAPWFATDDESFNTSVGVGVDANKLITGTLSDARLSSTASNFNESYSYLVYTDGTTTYAKNGTTGMIDYSGTGGSQVVQEAINQTNSNGGGTVLLRKGTITTSSTRPTLLIRQNVTLTGEGIDSSIIRMGDGVQTTVIEMDNNSMLQDMTVDGNEINNRQNEETWFDVDDVPHAQNIHTLKEIWAAGGIANSNISNIRIKNVKSINALRSNLAVGGHNALIDNVYLEDSYTDHNLYLSGAHNATIRNVRTSGMANTESVVIGTSSTRGQSYDNLLESVYIYPAENGKFNFPTYALGLRSLAGERNTFRDIHIFDNGTVDTLIAFKQNYTLAENIRYCCAQVDQTKIWVSQNNSILRDVFITITSGTPSAAKYALNIAGNNNIVDNFIATYSITSTNAEGIFIDGTSKSITGIIVLNPILNVPGTAIRVAGDVNPVSYKLLNPIFLNSKTITETGTVIRNSIDHGRVATAPTAFGAGDTYFNSTAGYPCWRNATSWNRYNDSVGVC